MSKKRLRRFKGKSIGLGGIGVPGTISESPMNTLPGQPFSTPSTTVTGWPAPNLWYAQGRAAAKKTYYEYLNALNTYMGIGDDQVERRLKMAGEMNGLIVSMIQGVTIALEADEIAARRARSGDQAGAIEQDVIADTVDKMLKTIWVHNTAAYSGNFAGLENKMLDPSIVGRLVRVGFDKTTTVGIPPLTTQEVKNLWIEDPLSPPLDLPGDEEIEIEDPNAGEAPAEEEALIPSDELPPPENESANDFVAQPARNVVDVPSGEEEYEFDDEESEMPRPNEEQPVESVDSNVPINQATATNEEVPAEETQETQEVPTEETASAEEVPTEAPGEEQIATEDEAPVTEEAPVEVAEEAGGDESESLEEAPEDLAGGEDEVREAVADMMHEVWARWIQHLFASGELQEDGSLLIPASDVARWQRQVATNYDELSEEEKEKDRELADKVLGIMEEPAEEVIETEEAPEGEEVEVVDEAAAPEGETEVVEGEPEGEVVEEEAEEEAPEEELEEETVYCVECGQDVTEEEIAACENPDCPYHQEEETEEEPPIEKGMALCIMTDAGDHSKCERLAIEVKEFEGVGGQYCSTHNKIISYTFDQDVWRSDDARGWVSKQLKNTQKNAEDFFDIDHEVAVKGFGNDDAVELDINPEDLKAMIVKATKEAVIEQVESKLGPLTKRLKDLEA